MRVLVTGAAGFIGSHLSERLREEGHEVVALDSFTAFYAEEDKRANLLPVLDKGAQFIEDDLRTANLDDLLNGIDLVFHQAAQAGVRDSWDQFAEYETHDVIAAYRLLRAAANASVSRFVHASSSSVYGNALRYPTSETDLPRPISPYGVTKLASEHLCRVFSEGFGLHTVALRYFTVFGPRQRPDMAFHRLIEAALTGKTYPQYGTGHQVRDFTFVGDVVEANLMAAFQADVPPGLVANLAGGGAWSLSDVRARIEEMTGGVIHVESRGDQPGDVDRTGGSTDVASEVLKWSPETPFLEGLEAKVRWHEERMS